MLPLFSAIREMYNITKDNKENNCFAEAGYPVLVEDICLRNVLKDGTVAGRLICVKLDKDYLKMLPPDNCKSPYQQISNTVVNMDAGNIPVIMYTRRPGMIVGYDYNGAWTHSMTKSSPDSFIIGLFVLNSSNNLKNDENGKTLISLEEYIRQGEKADHAAWNDHNVKGSSPKIVNNIQKNIIKKINQNYKEKIIDTSERKNIGLSHALADMLLPAKDFGKKPSFPSGGGSGSSGASASGKKSSFRLIGKPDYNNGTVTYNYELFMRKNKCIIESEVITDFTRYSADKWEEDIDKSFPISVDSFSVTAILDKSGKESYHQLSLEGNVSDDDCSVEALRSVSFSVVNAVRIESSEINITVRGKLSFHSDSQAFKVAFSVKE